MFVGKGRFVEEIAPGDVSRVAKALGTIGDWKGVVQVLQSKSTEGGGLLPPLNRLRCVEWNTLYRADGYRAGWVGAVPALWF